MSSSPQQRDATVQPGSGFGLVGLAERCELAGGRLDAGPTPEGGWRLAAALPGPAPVGSDEGSTHAPARP